MGNAVKLASDAREAYERARSAKTYNNFFVIRVIAGWGAALDQLDLSQAEIAALRATQRIRDNVVPRSMYDAAYERIEDLENQRTRLRAETVALRSQVHNLKTEAPPAYRTVHDLRQQLESEQEKSRKFGNALAVIRGRTTEPEIREVAGAALGEGKDPQDAR